MLPNEVFALECLARYAREGLVRDSTWEFAHCPEPRPEGQTFRKAGDKGYYLTFFDHQHQGLLQSIDFDCRCFFSNDVKIWLDTEPPGHEELYKIFLEFMGGKHCPNTGKTQWKNELIQKQRMSFEKPEGEGWEPGMLKSINDNRSKTYTTRPGPMAGRTGALNPLSKAIIAIEPDGTEWYYESCREAGRVLGMTNLASRYLIPGKSPTRGNYKDWKFIYAK